MIGLSTFRPYAPRCISRFHTCRVLEVPRKLLKEFKLADIGEGITECEVIRWNVKPRSAIQAFDPLCEVQSDKASVEITSPFEGVVKEILVKEGGIAKVGAGLCTIEVDEEDDGNHVDAPDPPAPTSPAPEITTAPEPPSKEPSRLRKLNLHPLDPRVSMEAGLSAGQAPSVLATPSVRHYARQNGVDLTILAPGSGKGGRIERQDVHHYLVRRTASKMCPSPSQVRVSEGEIVVELGRTRLNMWKAMSKSLEIPQFGFSTTLDLTELHHMLPLLNSHIPVQYLPSDHVSCMRSPPVITPSTFLPLTPTEAIPESACYSRLTYLPFLLKTLSKAMQGWPLFRSSLTLSGAPHSEKPTLTVRPQADISIALSTPTGLYTPTIHAVDKSTIYDIASRLKHLAHLGRQIPCTLTPAEMPKRGGTITVSNIGGVGDVDSAMPVLVPGGGVAIMAVGRAKWVWDVDRFENGARRLTIGISWSADHRVVEGAELVAFVETWRSWIETPSRLIGYAI